MKMQIGKWGNSLAVRLPREIVEKFSLKEGDAIDGDAIEAGLAHVRDATAAVRREEALAKIEKLRWPLPDDWKFDREEANAR